MTIAGNTERRRFDDVRADIAILTVVADYLERMTFDQIKGLTADEQGALCRSANRLRKRLMDEMKFKEHQYSR